MVLKINNNKFEYFNQLDVTTIYDSVASTFAFVLYFDPNNETHKACFRPGLYPSITITEGKDTLITGTILKYKFFNSANKSLVAIAGYSKTGVLGNCEIPASAYPLQSTGLSLTQIIEKIAKAFGLKIVIDPAISDRANKAYASSTAKDDGTCQDYIAKLAGQKQIMLTHNELGDLVLTEAKINQAPIFNFQDGNSGISIGLDFDGEKMHNTITLQKQATKTGKGNAGISTFTNPYVNAFRPKTTRQTSGNDVDTAFGARNVLSDELKGIPLTITIEGWFLNGKIVRPNSIITVLSPENFLYKKTKFFIESVNYKGDEKGSYAVLNCCLPECFTNTNPINIFL